VTSDPKVLSGGEKRRVALCRLLLREAGSCCSSTSPPTTSTPRRGVARGPPAEYPGAVILVTHDRYFLDNVVEWILELDHGKGCPSRATTPSGSTTRRSASRRKRRPTARASKKIQRELEWVRASPKARQAKSKARLEAFDTLVAEAGREQRDGAEIKIPPGPRLGRKVIEVHGIKKAYGDKLLYENFSFSLPPGAILGIVGANGAGKTTLFRMLVGARAARCGAHRGRRDRQAQLRGPEPRRPAGDASVYDEVSGGTEEIDVGGGRTVRARQYVGWFNFKGSDHRRRSARSRAVSATACTSPSCCAAAATCCCSTSPPTTSTWRRCSRSSKRSSSSPAAA
jgi:sulfate-transporting ATPase